MRYLLLIVFVLFVMVGCNQAPQNEATPPQNNNRNEVRVKQTVPPKRDIKNSQEVSDRLENLAERIPQVNDATCVVIGNTAVVGINVNGDLDRSRVGTIKYSVAEALRKDPYGAHAIVTADMDLTQRIRAISADIRRGRPVAGFAEEMADIIGRIIPQLPQDVMPRNNPPAKSDDRHKLNNQGM